ncbi:unnamed protein product [Blepharisma stoltei]|uniref:Uncharacterized protein n=1 Tax=Blepharisma stoltei TaxID=1481888 RepID=A0AAU9JTQ1_9CILI|nr:unnamed protein product [Blepharisma stoltei]
MGCMQDTTVKGADISQPSQGLEFDFELNKSKPSSKNALMAGINENVVEEEVVIDDRALFAEDLEVITFKTERNDIAPLQREEILEKALQISQHSVNKIIARQREEKGQQRLKIDKDALVSGFAKRIAAAE